MIFCINCQTATQCVAAKDHVPTGFKVLKQSKNKLFLEGSDMEGDILILWATKYEGIVACVNDTKFVL